MKNFEIINVNAAEYTDEQMLTMAMMMAINEFKAGWRISQVQFTEDGTGAVRTYFSNPSPDGWGPWDNGDEYDCRLAIVTIVRKGGENSYTYMGNGKWLPW